jgi:hypothetical protein
MLFNNEAVAKLQFCNEPKVRSNRLLQQALTSVIKQLLLKNSKMRANVVGKVLLPLKKSIIF